MNIGYESFYDLSYWTVPVGNDATSLGYESLYTAKQNKEDTMNEMATNQNQNKSEYELELEYFKRSTEEMYEIFAGKRKDYGPTTTKTFEEYGIVAMLVRMEDKFGRLKNLSMRETVPNYESIEDTLMDLANYCIITMLEIAKHREKERHDNR